jgi:hypothetical protein
LTIRSTTSVFMYVAHGEDGIAARGLVNHTPSRPRLLECSAPATIGPGGANPWRGGTEPATSR